MNNIVTLVGRPNVGKSTIFNKFTKTNNAIVADTPGYTRDCQSGLCTFREKTFHLIDTAGLFFKEGEISDVVEANTFESIIESDIIMFIVDAQQGLVSSDLEIAKKIRKLQKKIYFIINKIDLAQKELSISEFSELGFENTILISAKTGEGITNTLESIASEINDIPEEYLQNDLEKPNISILGKPNVGKSTLVNFLFGSGKQITENKPGTTRDCIKIPIKKFGYDFNIVDTPGVRRKSKTKSNFLEIIGIIKTLKTVEASDIVILLIDSLDGITDQDVNLIGRVIEIGKPAIIALNKIDNLDSYSQDLLNAGVDKKLKFINHIPILRISAKTGQGIKQLLESTMQIQKISKKSISTSLLNDIVKKAITEHQPPSYGGKPIKIKYVHQGGNNPLRLILHGSYVDKLSKDYLRYLSNFIRKRVDLLGLTIIFDLKNQEK
jgi:GTP-binding protein|tara:strand:+ start:370 stop:1683 length:1314 start_codon:yes stop_codon:yes gene_type:complete